MKPELDPPLADSPLSFRHQPVAEMVTNMLVEVAALYERVAERCVDLWGHCLVVIPFTTRHEPYGQNLGLGIVGTPADRS